MFLWMPTAGIMPTLPTHQSPIAPDLGSPDKIRQEPPSSLPEATNPARLNRSKITQEPGKAVLRKAPPPPSPAPETQVSDRKSSVLPKDQIKTYVSEAQLPPSDPMADKLEALSRDIKQKLQRLPKAEKKGSEKEFKQQISQIEKSLQNAKSLQREARNTVWQIDRDKTFEEIGAGRYEGNVSKSQTEQISSEAKELVEELRHELIEAKKQLKGFESRVRSTKRLHRVLSTLQKGRDEFHEVNPGLLTSSKEHSKHIRVLEKQLHHASSVHSGAEKLLKTGRTASQQGLKLEDVRTEAESIRNEAATEIKRLKKEISNVKGSKESAVRREAKEKADTKQSRRFARAQKKVFEKMEKQAKREARTEQRNIDLQLKKDAVQDAELQRKRGEKLAPTTEKEARRSTVEAVKRGRTARAKAKAQARKVSTNSAVRQEKVHMSTFLAGIRGKRMSVDRLEDMIWSIHTPKDFKQAIANIQASGLDDKTQVRLRSLVSAALNGFVKNESNVRQIDNQFVAHVMFGDSKPEVLANYEKTVQRLAQKLDR